MTIDNIKQLFDYTEWANHLALDAASALTAEQRKHDFKISHGSIHGTLLHMAAAEWIWLERWHGTSPTQFWPAEEFPDLAAIRARWSEIEQRRSAFLAEINDAALAQDLSFRLLNGTADALPLGGQMQHVVNHATLHRGQVVGMIRQLGVAPPATDYLFYLRAKR
jgi:uncharacterized damage-inducible protein DinB